MATTTWALDPTHSEVTFKVRHLMVSNVSGQFKQFTASVETEDDDIATAKVHFSADIDSISTNNDQRDGHLKNTDFFDMEKYPKIAFESTSLEKKSDDEYLVHGNFSMLGVTKPVTLKGEFGGITKDPWGMTRMGFSVSGTINRKDYGMHFGTISETGGAMLGADVKIHCETEFVKQQAA